MMHLLFSRCFFTFSLLQCFIITANGQIPSSATINKNPNEIKLLADRMKAEYLAGYIPVDTFVYPVNGYWPDINYKATATSEWVADRHWDRMITMAKLFHSKMVIGNRDTVLLSYILQAIDYWSIKKPVCSNYWWNAIGVPLKMGQLLLLMDGHLPDQSVNNVISFMKLGIKDDHYEYYGAATGQNQVWLAQVHSMIGLLQRDTTALKRAFTAFHNEVYLSNGEGIQYDYSFFQHGHQLYSGGYGIGYTKDIAKLIRLSYGTSYQFPDEKIDLFCNFILKGQQWLMYKGVFDYSTMGREISRFKNADGRVQSLVEVCEEMASLNIPKKNELKQMASSLKENYPDAITGNKHFWRSDLMVHRTPTFYTSIKMTSSRIKSSEWGNQENEKSFYLGQGVQLLMRNGTEYKQIFPVWDWQKLPGALNEQRDTLPKTKGPWGDGAFGKRPFAGGVSNGTIGMAVNDYELENVKARRAWFCFNREVIVMGAGIENNAQHSLLQTVNQTYQFGEVVVKSMTDKKPAVNIDAQTYRLNTACWIYHDSIAYFFPQPQNITVKANIQKGAWSSINGSADAPKETIEKKIFSAWIDFGKQVKNKQFMYAIVPGISKSETDVYQLPVRVISNNKQQQAVWHMNEKAWMVSFYVPGTMHDQVKKIKLITDKPVLVLLREAGNSIEISVANPLNKGASITLFINRKLSGAGCSWSEKTKMTSITIALPSGNYAGQSITKQFIYSK